MRVLQEANEQYKQEPEWIVEAKVANERRLEPVGEVQEREIEGNKFKPDTSLCKELQDKIVEVISRNMNVFMWSSADMPGIDPDILCHRLTMDERIRPVV